MNVKAPYLSLDEARAVIDNEGCAWEGSAWQTAANADGWNIFNLGMDPPADPVDAGIEKYDTPEDWAGCERTQPWADDATVASYCEAKVASNDDPIGTYATALKIEHALNSIRFHVWGEDWVDSRMGPG